MNVVAVNRFNKIALMSDGTTIPISGFMDEEGEECDPDDAVTCWGQHPNESWWAIDLREFLAHPTQ